MLQEIQDILILQKREIEARLKEKYVERKATMNLNSNIINVIIGPRRAGKSFFAIHFLHNIGNFGYVNFDDERINEVDNYEKIITAMNSIYDHPTHVLLDEIQNLPKWELFVNRLQRQGYHLVITGSNSNLLSRELSTHLTGRHLSTTIFPFSFKEFISLQEEELTSVEQYDKLIRYLTHGGFPEPLVKDIDVKEYLKMLFDSVVYKDIVQRYQIRNPKDLEELAYYLISNITNEYSFNSLTKKTNIKSQQTIQKYVSYLEETFLFFSINRFSYKVKQQTSSNRKLYCIDNGFILAKAFSISPDRGKLFENIIACELKKGEIDNEMEIFYWKNPQQEEVDFVIKNGSQVDQLIQVCCDLRNPETEKREIRALIKAGKDLRCDNLLIITDDKEGKEQVEWFGDKATIAFRPIRKWLLEKK
jgi:predicted AAA+ superfamily ATPase